MKHNVQVRQIIYFMSLIALLLIIVSLYELIFSNTSLWRILTQFILGLFFLQWAYNIESDNKP